MSFSLPLRITAVVAVVFDDSVEGQRGHSRQLQQNVQSRTGSILQRITQGVTHNRVLVRRGTLALVDAWGFRENFAEILFCKKMFVLATIFTEEMKFISMTT
jgi:hypothetical protein